MNSTRFVKSKIRGINREQGMLRDFMGDFSILSDEIIVSLLGLLDSLLPTYTQNVSYLCRKQNPKQESLMEIKKTTFSINNQLA